MDRVNPRQPAVRAASVHDVLEYLDVFEPGARERARQRIPAEALEIIDATPRLGWIPIEHDVFVPTAMHAVLGPERFRELLRTFVLRHVEASFLSPLVTKTSRLFGLNPVSLVRMLPVGWGLIYRDFCDIRVESLDATSAQVIFEDVVPEALASTPYLESFRAILAGVFTVTGHEGDVKILEIDRDLARVVFAMDWQVD